MTIDVPLRPSSVPVTRSIATYPADPFTSVWALSISLAGPLEVPAELLVDGHPSDPGPLD